MVDHLRIHPSIQQVGLDIAVLIHLSVVGIFCISASVAHLALQDTLLEVLVEVVLDTPETTLDKHDVTTRTTGREKKHACRQTHLANRRTQDISSGTSSRSFQTASVHLNKETRDDGHTAAKVAVLASDMLAAKARAGKTPTAQTIVSSDPALVPPRGPALWKDRLDNAEESGDLHNRSVALVTI